MDPRLIYLLIFALLLATIVYLQKNYCILCDVSTAKPRPFSFSRVQLTWWTFLILASIVAVILATGQIPNLDDSTLGLLGIGAVTHIASTAIDVSNNQAANNPPANQTGNVITYVPQPAPQYNPSPAPIYTPPQPVASDGSTIADATTMPDQASIAQTTGQPNFQPEITQAPAIQTAPNPSTGQTTLSANMPSEGFLQDILSDKYGISIHRFQAFIFNLVFGLWFIYKTVVNLKGITTSASGQVVNAIIPVFSTNNLILLGLSAGTYAALKLTENKQ